MAITRASIVLHIALYNVLSLSVFYLSVLDGILCDVLFLGFSSEDRLSLVLGVCHLAGDFVQSLHSQHST